MSAQRVAELVLVLLLFGSLVATQDTPIRINITTLNGDVGTCPANDQLEEVRSATGSEVRDIIRERILLLPQNPCSALPDGSHSGYYSLNSLNATQVYCDTNRTCSCANGTEKWMRVANLNMTDPNQQCPSGFRTVTSPRRSCGRPSTGCVSTIFPVNGIEYSRVCGRVIGYQFGGLEAFWSYSNGYPTIDDAYIDGVSLTYGNPRKHVWSFAGAAYEKNPDLTLVCPCTLPGRSFNEVVPPFIGQDYFCDTGSHNYPTTRLYTEDPLWDGQGCGSVSTCCNFNNPPWFCKQLPQPTRDDIETHSGMVKDVSHQVYAAISTILHGSASKSHSQLEMILSSGFVPTERSQTRIPQSK